MQQLQDALIDNSDEIQLNSILYVLEKKRKFDTLNTLKDLVDNNEIQLALKALELLESNNDLDISNILEFRNEMNQAFGDNSWDFNSNGNNNFEFNDFQSLNEFADNLFDDNLNINGNEVINSINNVLLSKKIPIYNSAFGEHGIDVNVDVSSENNSTPNINSITALPYEPFFAVFANQDWQDLPYNVNSYSNSSVLLNINGYFTTTFLFKGFPLKKTLRINIINIVTANNISVIDIQKIPL